MVAPEKIGGFLGGWGGGSNIGPLQPTGPCNSGRPTLHEPVYYPGFGLVLGHSDKAVVRWMLDLHHAGAGKKWWTFRKHSVENPAWRIDSLDDHTLWHVHEVRLCHGSVVGEGCMQVGLVVFPIGAMMPLMRHAAKNGFCHMTVVFLRRLRQCFDLKFPRGQVPKTELDWVRALMTHVLGEITHEQWQRILVRRKKDAVRNELLEESLLAQSGNAEVLHRSLHNMDLHEPVAELKASLKKPTTAKTAHDGGMSEKRQAAASTSDRAASSSSGSAAPRQPVQIDYDIDDTITLQEARTLLPPGGMYALVKDTTLHMRWQVKVKGPEAATYISKGWGPLSDHSVKSALRHVLQEAWAHHYEQTGAACPHNLRVTLG